MTTVRPARLADRDRAVEVTVRAFAADPIVRWFFPDDVRYEAAARAFFGTMLDLRLAGGLVVVDDEGRASAQWNPPGGLAVDPVEEERRWAEAAASWSPDEARRLGLYDPVVEPLKPQRPHWYLGVLAVDPDFQGRGLGTAVTAAGLARADAAGLPAVLETATSANLPLYERLGFEVVGEAAVPEGGPVVWVMLRPPDDAGR